MDDDADVLFSAHQAPWSSAAVNLVSIDLNLLVLLDALIEEVSVTRAAERVGLSQPAMSHALRRIRKLVGDEILIRQGAGSVLTPRAERLRTPLRTVLHLSADLLAGGAGFDPRRDTRVVTVQTTPSTAYMLGGRLTTILAEEAPRMRLRLVTSMDLSDAAFGSAGVDVMLISEAQATDFPRERLFDDDWVVVAGEAGLTDATAAQALVERPHVIHESSQLMRPYLILREHDISYAVQARTSDTLSLLHLIAGSGRVGIHRRRIAEVFARHAPLWLAAFPFPSGSIGMDVVWNPWLGEPSFRAWFQGLLRRAVDDA